MGKLYVTVNGFPSNCIVNVNGYFVHYKKKEWFDNPLVRDVVEKIDNSKVIKDEYIESPIFGGMAPERLSCGCKAVILMIVKEDKNIYASKCGDNCVPSIIDVVKTKDLHVTLHHLMEFPDVFPEGFSIVFEETGVEVFTDKEFAYGYYETIRRIE